MRKTAADEQTPREHQARTDEPTRIATDQEVKRAADRAIERNREALKELAKW